MVALFLALAAIQFVVAQNLPASSYVTPLGQLIVASYFTLFLAALESLLVFNFAVYAERQRRCHVDMLVCLYPVPWSESWVIHLSLRSVG